MKAGRVPLLALIPALVVLPVGAVGFYLWNENTLREESHRQLTRQAEAKVADEIRQAEKDAAIERERRERLAREKPIQPLPASVNEQTSAISMAPTDPLDFEPVSWHRLVELCSASIASQLKDPESIKVLSAEGIEGKGKSIGGKVYDQRTRLRYTATNSYGGRVSDIALCYFYRGSFVDNIV